MSLCLTLLGVPAWRGDLLMALLKQVLNSTKQAFSSPAGVSKGWNTSPEHNLQKCVCSPGPGAVASVVSGCLCSVCGCQCGWQLKDWAWHSAPAAGAPWPCVSRLRGVADAVPSHGGAHTVLSVEKELEWKNLGIC